ncbi:isoprenylcysteine carboxylmethyltransferase family protein [Halanaerobium sp. ST460_2HS_T2]|uniref:methyltransferase family protein n=1 Tax=Halanaerobium sp. ST460_2HS_T2 TaxID=2183914 RepID=UPI000DFA6D65|nr:isoprenylcysteine carboxylmethyltransferase family protein [Halanaerobium sp. ST460_2HS_T2]RCW48718.1 protein-S-isoprenylcysteine O-methyltransferase Ste14 [Halanaerobium sp. ST460_2HS_T2]
MKKILIVILFLYTWRHVQIYWNSLSNLHIYLYFSLVIFSLLSDKYFYQGQKSENNKRHEITSHFLFLTWFSTLIIPVLEYVYIKRYNLFLTILGTIFIILGTAIRGIAIKKLGKFFSRDVENWKNQKIVKTGIYKYIRHPAYTGNILQIIGFPLILNSYYSLLLSFITILVFLWRIKVEEEFLIEKLPEYKKYMEETKRLIPKLW